MTIRRPEPVTEWQQKALQYFGQNTGITTKTEAGLLLDQIFEDERNRDSWEGAKARMKTDTPATEAQWRRLNFAKRRLKTRFPKDLTKQKATDLIDDLYADIELELQYQDWKAAKERRIGRILIRFFLLGFTLLVIYIMATAT